MKEQALIRSIYAGTADCRELLQHSPRRADPLYPAPQLRIWDFFPPFPAQDLNCEFLLILEAEDMAALQDFIAAVYAAKLYIVILGVCAYGLRSYASYQRLAHIKGPSLAAWSNFWLVRSVYNLNTHQELYKVNKKYGMPLHPFDDK
jgi:hypothetical protein